MRSPLFAIAFAPFFGGAGIAAPEADLDGYQKTVAPFFESYCMDCHDEETQKGKLSLEAIQADILSGDHLEIWRLVQDQLFFKEMPPEKKKQPGEAERDAVLAWIRGEMLKTQRPEAVTAEKLTLPDFGNYVDHEFLFDKRLPRVTPAPPRIWRLRPDIYETVMPRLGEGISDLANGLSYLDGPVIKDYASEYFVDEASTSPLLGNAKTVAAALVGPRSRDKVFQDLVSESGEPSEEAVHSAVAYAFRKILGRAATEEEADALRSPFTAQRRPPAATLRREMPSSPPC